MGIFNLGQVGHTIATSTSAGGAGMPELTIRGVPSSSDRRGCRVHTNGTPQWNSNFWLMCFLQAAGDPSRSCFLAPSWETGGRVQHQHAAGGGATHCNQGPGDCSVSLLPTSLGLNKQLTPMPSTESPVSRMSESLSYCCCCSEVLKCTSPAARARAMRASSISRLA